MSHSRYHHLSPSFARVFWLGCAILSLLFVVSCAQQEPQIQVPQPVPEPVTVPARPFTADSLYALLLAEFAGGRDRLDVMLSQYVEQAQATQDLGVIMRATQLAGYVRQPAQVLAMSGLWINQVPENPDPHYLRMAALADLLRFDEARQEGEWLIARGQSQHGLDALAVRLAQQPLPSRDFRPWVTHYEGLAERYPLDAKVWFGLSVLQEQARDEKSAMAAALKSKQLDPAYEQAWVQELRLLEQQKSPEWLPRLASAVAAFPENPRLRLQWARHLAQTDLPAAALQFTELLKRSPDDGNIQLALALIHYEQQSWEPAKTHFHALIDKPVQASTALYYLGQIARQQNQPAQALSYYLQVPPSKEFLPALSKAVILYGELGQSHKIKPLLNGHRLTAAEEHQEGLAALLAQHEEDQGNVDAAIATLSTGLEQFPRSRTLRYTRAMLFAGAGQLAPAIADLEMLLGFYPEDPDILNALGYIFADANLRLAEADRLIEKALALEPNNPATLDSMGWLRYRQGRHAEAIKWLSQALAAMPNDEIAAHLGEVLWVSGDQARAKSVWGQGLQTSPDSPFIRATLKRFDLSPAEIAGGNE